MNAKDIYNRIEGLNPSLTTISSLGSFVSQSQRMVQQSIYNEVIKNIPVDSLAYTILTGSDSYSSKQIWVIAYELMKNEEYVTMVSEEINRAALIASRKEEERKNKLASNKAGSQSVLDFVKENGKLLKDYYAFVKKNKQFAREFYSKKFTFESAEAFLNK